MAESTETGTQETGTQESESVTQKAILFELEHIAVQGRKMIFDIVKGALKKEHVTLSVPMFSRYCVWGSPHDYIPAILESSGKKTSSAEKVASAIVSETKSIFSTAKLKQTACVQDILKTAEKHGAKVGALSALGLDLAESLVKKLGLSNQGIIVKSSGSGRNGYTPPDAWIRLAKSLQVSPFKCVAISTHAGSCRSSIAAHMRCVALPDEYTSYQDFSGADCILSTLDAAILDDVMGVATGF